MLTNSRDIIRRLERDGWALVRVTGSHHVFKSPVSDKTVVVPPDADAFDPNLRKNINNFVDAGTSYPLPSFHFRIGWQY